MPVKALESYFLHVYDVELGSWTNVMLGSPVSPPILEAMNLILKQDGILAYIGTRLEFGHFLTELNQETGKDFRHCWTSLPASTIMSVLGLCLNSENPRKPELVFYGSPLTIALAHIISLRQLSGMEQILVERNLTIARQGFYFLEVDELESFRAIGARMINASEHYEALSYLEERNEDEEGNVAPPQTMEIEGNEPSFPSLG